MFDNIKNNKNCKIFIGPVQFFIDNYFVNFKIVH